MDDMRRQAEIDRAWTNECRCRRVGRRAKYAREHLRTAVEEFLRVEGNRLTQSDRDDIFNAIGVLIIKAGEMEEIWNQPRLLREAASRRRPGAREDGRGR